MTEPLVERHLVRLDEGPQLLALDHFHPELLGGHLHLHTVEGLRKASANRGKVKGATGRRPLPTY